MSKIAMFGGSFNPVHIGHVGIVQRMIGEHNLDKVYVVPTYNTPLKDNTPMLTPEHRLNMCQLAFADLDNVVISDIEISRKGKSFTVDTLKELKRLHPDDEICLIIGADSFLQLRLWHDVAEIFEIATILTVTRDVILPKELNIRKEQYEEEYGARVFISCEPICKASSTEIRNAIKENKPFTHLLSDKVSDYISSKGLYGYDKQY